jgi:hypothetical protein
MDLSNKELVKSLTSLIDDTLQEIEEIKKSKFAASEIKIEGPGDGIDGKPVNGDLHAKKAEDKEEEKEEHEEDESKEDEKKEEAKKAEDKDEDKKEDDEDEDDKKKKKFDFKDLKKSIDSSEELMKSYVDSKFSAFEDRLEKMTAALESMANAPVARKGVPAGIQPLAKSTENEIQALNKSQVADRLFDLKKSGVRVDSSDVFKVETTKDSNELKQIADKYGIK